MNAADTLKQIEEKVIAGQRVSLEEGIFLDKEADLLTLGRLANTVRERKNGNFAYYNTNIHLNPTNVCVYRCRFCAFRADLKAEKAYAFSDDMLRERILEARSQGATEIHVVGGLHHQKKFDWYVNIVRVLHETCPEIHIKAWTAVEINWFSFITKQSTEWVLQQMVDAGLGSLPGGGAEIFHPEVRDQICEHKADAENWITCHRAAHQLGLRSNATSRASDGPSLQTAVTSRRDGGIPDVYSSGVPSRQHGTRLHQEADGSDGSANRRPFPNHARQLRPY
jgi:aminodeoxyfutalosine synthase